MKQSKVLESIQSLSQKEQKEFGLRLSFIDRSVNARLSQLFIILCPLVDEGVDIDQQAIFHQLYGDASPYQEKKIRVLFSQLFQHLLDYFAQLELKERIHEKDFLALSQLRKRQIESVFFKQVNQISKKLEQNPRRDADYHLARYELALQSNGYFGQQHRRTLDDSLQDMMNSLDAWFLSKKLKESCEMLNRENVFSIRFENPLIQPILAFLRGHAHRFWEIPSVQVYFQIYLCLSEENDEHYQHLVHLLEQLHPCFHPEEARGMYKHAQNYCIRRINRGDSAYLAEIFRLYQLQLDNELIFDRGMLAHTDYKNIVTVGLRLRENDWVKAFIHNFKSKVQASDRDNVFNFSLASYFFETGQNQQVIKLLQEVEFTDVYYQISARQLLLKLYYETDELEAGLYQTDSLSVFLRRNKEISVKNRTQHANFLKFYKQLLKLKDRKEFLDAATYHQRWKKLSDKIAAASHTSNLEWLRMRVSQLA